MTIVQTERNKACFELPRCRLSYAKIYKKIDIKHDYNVKMCMLFCLSTIDVLDN